MIKIGTNYQTAAINANNKKKNINRLQVFKKSQNIDKKSGGNIEIFWIKPVQYYKKNISRE